MVPAVSLRQDRVVIVRDNAYEAVEDERGEPFRLAEFIDIFLKDYPALLVVDIDGIEQGAAQYDALGELPSGGPEVWWDAAAHDQTDVINILTAGADKAVVSTRQLRGMRELEKAIELTENVVFELVTSGQVMRAQRRIAQLGGPEHVVARAVAAGAQEFLMLDTARPLGGPIAWDFIARAGAPAKTLFVGGGIAASQAASIAVPPALPVAGLVVDLISVLTPYL